MSKETNTTYSYRNGFRKHSYEIRDEGLHIKSSNLFAQHESKFAYDTIPSHPTSYTDRSKVGFWSMIVFSFFLLIVIIGWLVGESVERYAFVIWGSLSTACGVWYFLSLKNYIIYEGRNGLMFSIGFSKRQRQAANDFALLINETKHKCLEKKIEQYLPVLGRDRVNSLIIELRENLILDDNGYAHLMKKADEANSVNIVGFRKERN